MFIAFFPSLSLSILVEAEGEDVISLDQIRAAAELPRFGHPPEAAVGILGSCFISYFPHQNEGKETGNGSLDRFSPQVGQSRIAVERARVHRTILSSCFDGVCRTSTATAMAGNRN